MHPSGPPAGGPPADSPRKVGAGGFQNHVQIWPQMGSARSSRIALAEELSDHLHFNDDRVFDHLHLYRVSENFVTSCCNAMEYNAEVKKAKQQLQEIAHAARGKREEDEWTQGISDDSDEGKKKKEAKKAEERKMYAPLMTIFSYIENYGGSNPAFERQYNHTFHSTDKVELKSDGTTYGFPKSKPDFTLLDFSGLDPEAPGRYSVMWRHQAAFCEVKPSDVQSPYYVKANRKGYVKQIVSQAADYARLHLSARPFQLFSLALLIFGAKFCVALFDREGVLFSPVHDMWSNMPEFVRVVRAMTCYLSPGHLGRDPSAVMLSEDKHRSWLKTVRKKRILSPPEDYPTFELSCVPSLMDRKIRTVGRPIWTSLSLLGRGTTVWLVGDKNTDEFFILKNSWRKNTRMSESNVYRSIVGTHDALAVFEEGGDVYPFVRAPYKITVQNLRQMPTVKQLPDDTPDTILHRLLLKTLGRPIIEWKTFAELLSAVRAAVSAHQFLCDQGILHRDVSAGNVMLSMALPGDDEPAAKGFLMDVEFAHIAAATYDHRETTVVHPVRGPGGTYTKPVGRTMTKFGQTVLRGGIMTGTANFMAWEALNALTFGSEEAFEHKAYHDLESFVYVLAYGLFGGLFLTDHRKAEIPVLPTHIDQSARRQFQLSFGRMDISNIRVDRRAMQPLEPAKYLAKFLPLPVILLTQKLDTKVRRQQEVDPGWTLSHGDLLQDLDVAIQALEAK